MSISRIDEKIEFIPLNIAIITISDTRSYENDKSGKKLIEMLENSGHSNTAYNIVKDDFEQIQGCIKDWVKREDIDIIITTGGTGLTGRDVTLDAIKPLFDKVIDGFSTVFHIISYQTIGTSTVQSRPIAGIINQKYVFCIPGSTGACKDAWNGILKYQLDIRHKPCNFVDILPRLNE